MASASGLAPAGQARSGHPPLKHAGFRGLSVGVLDSLPEIGGQVSAMYPEKLIYDIAGFPAVRGRDLIARLADQAAPYAPRYILGEEARYVDYAGGQPVVTTSSGLRVRARYLEECLPRAEYWDVPVSEQTGQMAPARILQFLASARSA